MNRALQQRYFPGEDAIGKSIRLVSSDVPLTIVGVVADQTLGGLDEARPPILYYPDTQAVSPRWALLVRSPRPGIAEEVRRAVRDAAPGLVVGPARRLDDVLQQAPTMFLRRYPPFLLGVFAGVALALACVGIFGVVSFGVVQRTREFGVRMAVGAVPADIVRLVLRASSGAVLAGAAAGLVGSVALATVFRGLLFGVAMLGPARPRGGGGAPRRRRGGERPPPGAPGLPGRSGGGPALPLRAVPAAPGPSRKRDRCLGSRPRAGGHSVARVRRGPCTTRDRGGAPMARNGTQGERASGGGSALSGLLRDAAYALRQLGRAPGFTSAAIGTLALGIGATSAIFSLVWAVVLKPLPGVDPQRTVAVESLFEGHPGGVSAGNFVDWQARTTQLERLAAVDGASFNLSEAGPPERVAAARVSSGFFEVFHTGPRLGRTFVAPEDAPGQDRVVVLSEGLWRRRFGANPEVLGRAIRLGADSYTVVGVMPARFDPFLDHTQLWVPLALTPDAAGAARRALPASRGNPQGRRHPRAGAAGDGGPRSAAGEGVPEPELRADGADHAARRVPGRGHRSTALHPARGGAARAGHRLPQRGQSPPGPGHRPDARARGPRRPRRRCAAHRAAAAHRERGPRRSSAEWWVWASRRSWSSCCAPRRRLTFPVWARRHSTAWCSPSPWSCRSGAACSSACPGPPRRADRSARDAASARPRPSPAEERDRLRGGLIVVEVALASALLVGAGLLVRTALYLGTVEPGFRPHGLLSARLSLPPGL